MTALAIVETDPHFSPLTAFDARLLLIFVLFIRGYSAAISLNVI
jgi:hypothetical protein